MVLSLPALVYHRADHDHAAPTGGAGAGAEAGGDAAAQTKERDR